MRVPILRIRDVEADGLLCRYTHLLRKTRTLHAESHSKVTDMLCN